MASINLTTYRHIFYYHRLKGKSKKMAYNPFKYFISSLTIQLLGQCLAGNDARSSAVDLHRL